jgi:hypothetical protein
MIASLITVYEGIKRILLDTITKRHLPKMNVYHYYRDGLVPSELLQEALGEG